MSIFLWVLFGIVCYFVIGLIVALLFVKHEGKNMSQITDEDIAMPLFIWPLMVLCVMGIGMVFVVKKLFNLLAVHVFKVPLANTNSVYDDGGGAFIPSLEQSGGSNPPPTTPKPDVIPPSQKTVVDIPRTDLIDID